MSKPFRRIVAGVDSNNQSCIESDQNLPVTFALESEWPGFSNIEIWETEQVPPCYSDNFVRQSEYDFDIEPGKVRICTMCLPPVKDLIAHQQAKGNVVDVKTFGMHRTNTIDCVTLLSGEMTLILENGDERTLKPGDSVVMRGNPHAWQNRGAENCYVICTMIGAKEA